MKKIWKLTCYKKNRILLACYLHTIFPFVWFQHLCPSCRTRFFLVNLQNQRSKLIPTIRMCCKPYFIQNPSFRLGAKRQHMWLKFVNMPSSWTKMSKLFVCLDHFKNWAINNRLMSICRTTCYVYFLILGNPLTKLYNGTSR